MTAAVVTVTKYFFIGSNSGHIKVINSDNSINTSYTGSNAINSFYYSSSLFSHFATGNSGTLLTSTDQTAWTSITTGSSSNLMGFATGSSLFNYTINPFTERTSNFGVSNVNAIAYGNSYWVAVGAGGTLRTASDAISWNTVTSNFGTTLIRCIAYGNGTWFAGGAAAQGRYSTSSTAATWLTSTTNVPNTAVVNAVAYGNGKWVLGTSGGALRTSTNAVTWATVTTPNFNNVAVKGIAYGNGAWVAVGNAGTIRYSTDTVNWATVTSNFGASIINGVTFNQTQGVFMAVGDAGQVRYSGDGITWITVTSPYTNNLRSASSNDSALFGVCGDNGVTFTYRYIFSLNFTGFQPALTTYGFGASSAQSIAYGNGIWAAAGYNGTIRTSTSAEKPDEYIVVGV